MRATWIVGAFFLVGCGANNPAHSKGSASEGGTASGDQGSGGNSSSTGGTSGGAGAAATSGGTISDGGSSAQAGGSSGGSSSVVLGGPGCGLESAAFCDTFDTPSVNRGRAGELDRMYWSASRMAPQGPTVGGQAFGVRAATLRPSRDTGAGATQLPECRAGLGDTVFPDDDTLICDASTDIASGHLLVAVASQNYGQNSYRIRQPFDFAGRTGKIVFDAEGEGIGLLGWISVEVTEDPIGAPSFQSLHNYEGGAIPKNGLTLQFNNECNGTPGTFSVGDVEVYSNYVQTAVTSSPQCIPFAWGKLNHFEVSLSATQLDVHVTPFSSDGASFEAPQLMFSSAISLPFSRGYVQITTHNHATMKYSNEGFGKGYSALDAWVARWDNVGFDGPVLGGSREYEVGDSLGEISVDSVPLTNTGYLVADEADGPSDILTFSGVNLTDVASARIALDAWYCSGCGSPPADFVLKYRLNGGTWRERPLSAVEAENISTGNGQGAVAEMLEVPLEDLVAGDNTLELVTVNVPHNYPPAVVNVDLILTTE